MPDKNPHESHITHNDIDMEEDFMEDEDGGFRIDDIYIPPPQQPHCSTESKGSRVIITKIANHWFKSYAGTVYLGPFHKRFNAIVGPNGSGKSNVIDAMLFVFGYRAAKIRSKKLSVLIHNSNQHSNIQSCSVDVHFAEITDIDSEYWEVVPDSEFIISRTVHKDNTSYYTINDRKVHFREVASLLKKHGIDLIYNRFLILQGEVEQIAMMNPKGKEHETGMLEYLEDIIGTTRYKVPLAQLYDRYDQLSDIRTEKINRVKIIENELGSLKEPMEDAIDFLKTENNITIKKNFYYQKNIFVLKTDLAREEENMSEADQELKELERKLNKVREEKEKNKEQLDQIAKDYENLVKKKEATEEALNKANVRDVEIKTQMSQLNNDRKKKKVELLEENQNLEKLQHLPETTAQELAECDKTEAKLVKKKDEQEAEKIKLLESIKDDTKELQERKNAIQVELAELCTVSNEKKSEFTLAESNLRMCTHDYDNEKKKLDNLADTYKKNETTIGQYNGELHKLRKLLPDKEKTLREASEEIEIVKSNIKQNLGEISKKRYNVNESKTAMQASKSQNTVLNALMREKQRGNCPGLFGRLGDLGAIDLKYDVAISTACGPLDNIVVDTVETGRWCIDYLKKNNIGRATIIALEKQEHLRKHCDRLSQMPEAVPRLFDLINIPDERVRPAFYYGVRDTLVADNLDQASRIAYGQQRYRVVTLQGALIEMTGTMSGGGNQVLKGRMGQSVTTTDIDVNKIEMLERELHEMEANFKETRQRETFLETQISDLTPELKQMKSAIEKMNMELKSLNLQQPMLQKQITAQEAKVKQMHIDPVALKKLQHELQKKRAAYEEAEHQTTEIQQQVNDINKELHAKTKGRVQKMEKALKETTNSLEKIRSEKTRLNVGLKTAARNMKKCEQQIAAYQLFIGNAEKKLLELKEERNSLETDAQVFVKAIDEIDSKISEDKETFSEMKAFVDQLTKKENKMDMEKIEIDEKYKQVRGKLANINAQLKQWGDKLNGLQLQEIPEQTMDELKTFHDDELKKFELVNLARELKALEEQLKTLKPNLKVIEDYQNKKIIYVSKMGELNEVNEKRNVIRGHYDTLLARRKDEFIRAFNIINTKLKEYYQMITIGGDADFELVDNFDPFAEGIQFRVRPPKKTWKNISNLSGGEKTLSSLALVFALHYYKPSPLYVMDEIDAALDFKNVSIVANYIKERTLNAQFIIISLRSNMFELTHYLIGIYKVNNCTKSITIDPRIDDDDDNEDEPMDIPLVA